MTSFSPTTLSIHPSYTPLETWQTATITKAHKETTSTTLLNLIKVTKAPLLGTAQPSKATIHLHHRYVYIHREPVRVID